MSHAPAPAKRPKPFRRAGYFRRTWYWYLQFPRYITLGAPVVLCLGFVLTAYLVHNRYQQSQKAKANVKLWFDFKKAQNAGDEAGMKAVLQELDRTNPGDQQFKRRLKAIESGEAEADDAEMALITFNKHLTANPPRWPEAEREARKCLALQPKDWMARCVLAHVALMKRDVEAASKELDQLPDPNKEDVNLHPGGLVLAFNLFLETQRDPAPLRLFVALRVVDRIRSPDTKTWPLALRISIIECFVRAFDPGREGKQLDGLNRAVASIGDLAETCVLDLVPAKDAAGLKRLGNLCNHMGSAFALLHKDGTISDDQVAALNADLEGRAERIWRAVLEIDPKSVEGYKGVAIAEWRKKNTVAARATIAEGLNQCGENPELLGLYSQFLRSNNEAKRSVQVMAKAALNDPKNLTLWLQLAEAAVAADDVPLAAEAVEHAVQLAPDDPRVIRAGAGIALVKGDPGATVHLLNRFGKPALAGDPTLARWYVIGMIDSGLNARLAEFLRFVEETAVQSNKPATLAAALNAINSATKFDPEATRLAIDVSERAMDRWPDQPELLTAQSMARYRIAENAEWELTATKNAIRALERLRAKLPDNPNIAAAIAWAKLKGEKNANRAMLDAAVLADAFKKDLPLSGWQMQVLGSAYVGADRATDAIAVLEKARATGYGSPGVLIPLSLAYYKAKKWDDAKTCILAVSPLKRSPQEQADYNQAVSIINP